MLCYAITDRSLTLSAAQGEHESLVAAVTKVARSGVDFLLIREKDLPAGELAELSRMVIAAVRTLHVSMRLLVAERLDVAVSVKADGVHLSARPGELTVEQVRRIFRKMSLADPLVSISCHTVEEVRRARDEGASIALFAPVFGKIVDGAMVSAGVGLDQLHEACIEARPMPVFALGGVTPANTAQCMAAGAAGVAGIKMFFAPAAKDRSNDLT